MSLDLPETLGISIRGRAKGAATATIAVEVNGISLGAIELQAAWREGRLDAPQALWQRGPNVITLRTTSPVDLDRVTFMEPER